MRIPAQCPRCRAIDERRQSMHEVSSSPMSGEYRPFWRHLQGPRRDDNFTLLSVTGPISATKVDGRGDRLLGWTCRAGHRMWHRRCLAETAMSAKPAIRLRVGPSPTFGQTQCNWGGRTSLRVR